MGVTRGKDKTEKKKQEMRRNKRKGIDLNVKMWSCGDLVWMLFTSKENRGRWLSCDLEEEDIGDQNFNDSSPSPAGTLEELSRNNSTVFSLPGPNPLSTGLTQPSLLPVCRKQ